MARHGLSSVMTITDFPNTAAKLQNRCDQSPTRGRGVMLRVAIVVPSTRLPVPSALRCNAEPYVRMLKLRPRSLSTCKLEVSNEGKGPD